MAQEISERSIIKSLKEQFTPHFNLYTVPHSLLNEETAARIEGQVLQGARRRPAQVLRLCEERGGAAPEGLGLSETDFC